MQPPPLVRRGGQAAGEQKLFVFAQAPDVPDFLERARDLSFHQCTLGSRSQPVELEMRGGFIPLAVRLRQRWGAHGMIRARLRVIDKHPVLSSAGLGGHLQEARARSALSSEGSPASLVFDGGGDLAAAF